MDVLSYLLSKKYADKYSQLKLFQCCSFGQTNTSQLTAGVAAGVTSRTIHIVREYTTDIKLIFANYFMDSTSNKDTENSVAVTFKASVEVNGVLYPCRFNGVKTKTLQPGEMAITDTLSLVLNKNDTFYVRVFHQVPVDGNSHPSGYAANWKGSGDLTESGIVPSVDYYGFAPIAVVGNTKQPTVLGVGDSIMQGSGDTGIILTDNGRTLYNKGFFTRALKDNLAFFNISKQGQMVTDYFNPNFIWMRTNLVNYSTHALVEVGINDIRSGVDNPTMKANLTKLWTMLKQRGMKVYQTTITPSSTSTDAWATEVNQTRHVSMPLRDAINDWIRTKPAPLDGYFEVADTVEPSRNAGIWKAGYTTDGLHPVPAAHAAMAAAIDYTKFV